RAGWTYISDDGVFVVRSRKDRYAVGDPHSIRFRPDASQLFPELANRMPGIRPNGKVAIEVLTRELDLETASGCHVDHIVDLNRREGAPALLRRGSEARLLKEWSRPLCFGTEETRVAQRRCHDRMLEAQLWEMQYSDLAGAVACLERLVEWGG